MNEEVSHDQDINATSKRHYTRDEVAAKISSFEEAKAKRDISQREFARTNKLPQSTVQGWCSRKAAIEAPAAVVDFLESPAGVMFLHRLVLAAQLVITFLAPGGIRLVCIFLILSGLDRFVASSYGSQQKAIATLENKLIIFGSLELIRLSKMMKAKRITLIEDETFHPQICLVAMEAASGFIFLEIYAENRDAATWAKELKKALGDLPITIVQVTSDEGKALIKHAEKHLEGHHSPDLFHPLQDLIRGTSLPMSQQVKEAKKEIEQAKEHTERLVTSTERFKRADKQSPYCSLTKMEQNIEEAKEKEKEAEKQLEEAQQQQEAMSKAIRGIATSYHPFDLETGQVREAEQVAADFTTQFERIDEISAWASLSQNCKDHIDKARRVIPLMVATISFFHEKIQSWVEELSLPEKIEQFVLKRWIPGCYLALVLDRAQTAEERSRLREFVTRVMPSKEEIESMLSSLGEDERLMLAFVVEECAQLFQRSSSAVEGRNGHLSLFHHGHHRLTKRKLAALTVIHNFMKRRRDGTTAAERFFGHPPVDLFEWLVEEMPLPVRPSKRRPQQAA